MNILDEEKDKFESEPEIKLDKLSDESGIYY